MSAFEGRKILVKNNFKKMCLISLIVNFDQFYTKRIKIHGNEECSQISASIYTWTTAWSMIYMIVTVVLLTYWIVFHFESSISFTIIRLKMNQDLIAWRDMAGRNWITTILSNHGWCTWSTIINCQGIIPEKYVGSLFFSFDIYKELELTRSQSCILHQKI